MSSKLSVFFVLTLSTWTVCKSEDVLWTRDKTLNDVVKTDGSSLTEERRAVSVVRCASLCTSASWCSSFFFLPTTEKCLLNEFIFSKRRGGQSSPGAVYFRAFSAACPRDGYVWLRGARTCIKADLIFGMFNKGYRICAKAGLRLAVLDKEEKLRGVAAYIADIDYWYPITRAYIGGMRDGVINGTRKRWNSTLDPLYWVNGVKIPTTGPDSYWQLPDINPSNDNEVEGCMEITTGLWNDITCDYYQPFICEKI